MKQSSLILIASAFAVCVESINTRPIIGILSMPSAYSAHPKSSAFPASYVKFLESGGSRVVPIPYDLAPDALTELLSHINGALFTGGAAPFWDKNNNPSQYALTAQAIFNNAVTAAENGESWPLWGTCLGHELISIIAAGLDYNTSPLSSGFDAENLTVPVGFTSAAAGSRLWGANDAASPRATFATGSAYNAHTMGVTPADFTAASTLDARFEILGTSFDRGGKEFVATMEGKTLPIFTTQWHPEKVAFEWNAPMSNDIPHSFEALLANFWPAAFFANQARANNRTFSDPTAENDALIYNYVPDFAPSDGTSQMFEQIYFFPLSA